MKPRALIVEDTPDVAEIVIDTLDSLNHEHDLAQSQEEARPFIARGGYTYVLLDLQIPVRAAGGMPRVQNGQNLAREIHLSQAMAGTPLIAMTAHGADAIESAPDLMGYGVVGFVAKPFQSAGPKTLDATIQRVLATHGRAQLPDHAASAPTAAPTDAATPAAPMELVIYPDHATLGGTTIITDRGEGYGLAILRYLATQRGPHGPASVSLAHLAEHLGGVEDGAVTGAVRTLRQNIERRVLKQLRQATSAADILVRDERGYRLTAAIRLRVP